MKTRKEQVEFVVSIADALQGVIDTFDTDSNQSVIEKINKILDMTAPNAINDRYADTYDYYDGVRKMDMVQCDAHERFEPFNRASAKKRLVRAQSNLVAFKDKLLAPEAQLKELTYLREQRVTEGLDAICSGDKITSAEQFDNVIKCINSLRSNAVEMQVCGRIYLQPDEIFIRQVQLLVYCGRLRTSDVKIIDNGIEICMREDGRLDWNLASSVMKDSCTYAMRII